MTTVEAVRLVSAALSVAADFSLSVAEIQALREASPTGHLTDEQEQELAEQSRRDVGRM